MIPFPKPQVSRDLCAADANFQIINPYPGYPVISYHSGSVIHAESVASYCPSCPTRVELHVFLVQCCAFTDAFLLIMVIRKFDLDVSGKRDWPFCTVSSTRPTCRWMLLVFLSILNCVWKSHEFSAFWNPRSSPSGIYNHGTVKVAENAFSPRSSIWWRH